MYIYEPFVDLTQEKKFLNHAVEKIAANNFCYHFDIYKESKIYLSEILESQLENKTTIQARRLKI